MKRIDLDKRNTFKAWATVWVGIGVLIVIFGLGRAAKVYGDTSSIAQGAQAEEASATAQLKQLDTEYEQTKQENTQLKAQLQASGDSLRSDGFTNSEKETIKKAICDTFGRHCQEALKVQSCEDGRLDNHIQGNKDGSIDVGVFQVNNTHKSQVEAMFHQPYLEAMLDPFKNVQFAYHLFITHGGWSAWYSSNSCHHLASKD